MVKKQSNSTSQLKQAGLSINGKYERQLYIKDSYETRILHLWSKMYQSISKCHQSIKETSQMVNLLSETTITEREKLQIFSLLFKNPAEKLKIKKKNSCFSSVSSDQSLNKPQPIKSWSKFFCWWWSFCWILVIFLWRNILKYKLKEL